jgi:hypothetical protein
MAVSQLEKLMDDAKAVLITYVNKHDALEARVCSLERELEEAKAVAKDQAAEIQGLKCLLSKSIETTSAAAPNVRVAEPVELEPTNRDIARAVVKRLLSCYTAAAPEIISPIQRDTQEPLTSGISAQEAPQANPTLLTCRSDNVELNAKKVSTQPTNHLLHRPEAPTSHWKCIAWTGVDVRSSPTFKRDHARRTIQFDQTFEVSEKRPFHQGQGFFLKLADGSGWVPSRGKNDDFCQECQEKQSSDPWALWRTKARSANEAEPKAWNRSQDSWTRGPAGSSWSYNDGYSKYDDGQREWSDRYNKW